jgi:hypothetical protein
MNRKNLTSLLRITGFFCIFTILIISHIIPVGQAAEASSIDVKLSLETQSKTAQVAPGDSGIATFNGSVTVKLPDGYNNPAAFINVTLYAEDSWNSCILEPEFIIFHNSGEKRFCVKVFVPINESRYATGRVTVMGTWEMDPGGFYGKVRPSGGVDGRINVAQFYNVSLSSPKPIIEVKPGEVFEFELIIKNEGNGLDMFTVDIINERELNEKCTTLLLSKRNSQIPSNHTETVKIKVFTGEQMDILGEHDIKVSVCSEKGLNEGVEPQVFTFTLKVPEKYLLNTTDFSFLIVVIIIIIIAIILSVWWRRRKRKFKDKKVQK